MALQFNGMTPADFEDTARRAVAACEGKSLARQAALLAADGLLSICVPEAAGGMGLPIGFALPVAEAGGRALLRFPMIETLLVASSLAEALEPAARVAAGGAVATVAWKGRVARSPAGDRISLSGSVGSAPFADGADFALLRTDDGCGVLVDLRVAGASVRAHRNSLDVVHPEFTIVLDKVEIGQADLVSAETMDRIERDALLLQAAATVGSAEFCLAAATRHATDRKQFGKVLIGNQAIRHGLARQKLALESARVALGHAAAGQGSPHAARIAFLAAVTGGVAVAEGAIQVHGGMGFTWEVPLHFYLRHIRSLEAQGDAAGNLDRLAEAYVAGIAPALEAA
ncbi:acyl-CoA dehydrogenase family protein [Mesorhizobium sp. L-8-3]|uniref:acyl-CoA dehydrogenase family protein n=1 Tax=Mesorhizobium sp. L-8-3 TaxID=2744522 RepID=UPI001927968D|nr:acyl-CoA dehydrogenase family protein [Mesorhizobium sp. L-8-3]BCH21089.1 hypothetical protein MesoLjLb_08740 [Mesorhizobium sp. L-8-3]